MILNLGGTSELLRELLKHPIPELHPVEINEGYPNKIKGYLFRACSNRRLSHHRSNLVETQRQAEEWEGFMVGEKEGFRCAKTEGS